jgi:hypothetical protein
MKRSGPKMLPRGTPTVMGRELYCQHVVCIVCIVNMLLQHCSTVTTWNNMVDNLFIVGRTTLFTPVDINLEQPVRF